QATDDIQIGKAVLAGPYHPAFRELVEADMIKDYLEFVILQNKNIKQMLVKSNKKNISKIIGNKKTNVKYMEEKFGVLLKTQESDLDINQLEIVLDGKSLISANMRDIHRKLYDIYDL
ncbi:radical SAM protein, partial [Clostridioides difficile]